MSDDIGSLESFGGDVTLIIVFVAALFAAATLIPGNLVNDCVRDGVYKANHPSDEQRRVITDTCAANSNTARLR